MKYILMILTILMTGCTYSINMAHTSGTASDVIDDTPATTLSPNVNIPLK
jgi:hypothetical protein